MRLRERIMLPPLWRNKMQKKNRKTSREENIELETVIRSRRGRKMYFPGVFFIKIP